MRLRGENAPPVVREVTADGSAYITCHVEGLVPSESESGARWATVGEPFRGGDEWIIEEGPRLLPQLATQDALPYTYAVRPAGRAEWTAWAIDVCGLSRREVVRLLHYDGANDKLAQAGRDQVRRDLPLGRNVYAARGVLPWTAFDGGDPPRQWWRTDEFVAQVERWRREAVTATPRAAQLPTVAQQLTAIARATSGPVVAAVLAVPLPAAVRGERLAEIDRTPWRPPW